MASLTPNRTGGYPADRVRLDEALAPGDRVLVVQALSGG